MKKVYRSKIGLELVAILLIALIPAFYTMFVKQEYDGLPVLAAVTAFTIHLLATTKYTVNDNILQFHYKQKCIYYFHKQD